MRQTGDKAGAWGELLLEGADIPATFSGCWGLLRNSTRFFGTFYKYEVKASGDPSLCQDLLLQEEKSKQNAVEQAQSPAAEHAGFVRDRRQIGRDR